MLGFLSCLFLRFFISLSLRIKLKTSYYKLILKAGLLVSMTLLLTTGCKKKRAFNEESAQDTADTRMAQGENEEVIKDVDLAIMERKLLTGSASAPAGTSLCGVIIDTSLESSGIITLRFKDTSCYNKKRKGSIKITMEGYPLKKWKHAGSRLRVDFTAYQVTRMSDGKSVMFDGTEYITNISGDTWLELWFLNTKTLVHTVTTSNLKITFNNGDIGIMNINRRQTYTYVDKVTICKTEGIGNYNGKSNLDNWGQTRDGSVYTCEVITPIEWKTSCGAMAPLSGEVSIDVEGKEYEMKCLFGVNKEGDVVSDPNTCPYGWKTSWSRKKKTNTRVFGYY